MQSCFKVIMCWHNNMLGSLLLRLLFDPFPPGKMFSLIVRCSWSLMSHLKFNFSAVGMTLEILELSMQSQNKLCELDLEFVHIQYLIACASQIHRINLHLHWQLAIPHISSLLNFAMSCISKMHLMNVIS